MTDSLSLVNHAVDVASVFRELCELRSLHRALAREAVQPLTDTHLDRLAVFALLHDLGKCNRGFQARIDPKSRLRAGHIRETAALLYDDTLREGAVAALGLADMATWFVDPDTDMLHLLVAAISHHGEPAYTLDQLDAYDSEHARKLWRPDATYDPFAALAELGQAARETFPSAFEVEAEPLSLTEPLEHRFAGLLMLADWLGSHRDAFFPFHQEGSRIPWARRQAKKALAAVGLDVSGARGRLESLPSFSRIFDITADPKPLQVALADADLPPLIIAESDTGSGKTEAAILHFLALFAAGAVDGLYFALPTRVAARELYGRVLKAMNNVFGPDHPPVLLAVPGYARIDGEAADLLPDPAALWHEAEQMRRERAWSAERPKRYLAAPVAVGTIDQALLSVIQVPHAHLRAACLDRSLLVIDEVHSSDVYMRYLSRRLLARHLA
ncbi:CRISPR-associated endonuclease Cas3'', partial [Parasulfuritortus cantonensis]|uniref:CRISPR-associated endonuclease Cas3'' n=1 Tax=Parasulfuritortus cantonensis TaxID=2528202 RepID=UPI0014049631